LTQTVNSELFHFGGSVLRVRVPNYTSFVQETEVAKMERLELIKHFTLCQFSLKTGYMTPALLASIHWLLKTSWSHLQCNKFPVNRWISPQ